MKFLDLFWTKVFPTRTFRQSLLTIFATIANALLGLLFYILVARILGPANFGILSVAIVTLTLIADIGDLGTDTGLIRFVGKFFSNEKQKALQFMKLGLEIKLLVWIFILSFGWFTAPFIASTIFTKPELQFPLQIALIGVGGALLFSFVTHSLQALQKFWLWGFLNISLNGLRLLVIIILGSNLNIQNILLTYISVLFLGFFLGLTFLPGFLLVKNERSVASDFFHYNKWIAITALLAAFSSRLDTYLSAKLVSSSSLGIYAAANQLSSIVPQLVMALSIVVAPKLAGFKSNNEAWHFLRRLQLLTFGLAAIGLLAIPLSSFIIPFIYGSAYNQSQMIFLVLYLSQLIFLISVPANQAIFYYFAKPQLFALVSLGQLLIMIVVGWFLISNFGIQGTAFTVLVTSIFGFIIPAIWTIYQFKK